MMPLVIRLNGWAARIARRAELFAAAVVIAIVLMLVLPMPAWLLDVLIAVNLCVAGLMVVVAMYMPGPTAFTTFPAVLLLSTLFRLAIEVATTRLILLEGYAGDIVETFGNFVVGGNLVVGLVVFLILTVVQFIVITKGSERVSEVAARFSLDAMPGKQMSIDSDLRAGLLSGEQARRKRAELGKESQLHGAMDGAMKFVKGDAIAGLCIVAVNLIGGISIGVIQRGMAAGDAAQLYSILTIGDALIAQIPALLISLAAGMITTRIAGDEPADGEAAPNIGQTIVAELFAEPKALLTAAVIMLLFGAIPGMPLLVFGTLAAALAVAGALGLLKPRADAELQRQGEERDKRNAGLVDLTSFTATQAFVVRMPEALRGSPAGEAINGAVRIMRNALLERRGIPDLQPIEFEYHASVPSGRVHFLMAEVPLLDCEIRAGWAVTDEAPERLRELGFCPQQEDAGATRRRRVWLRLDQEQALKAAGVPYLPWAALFAADVEAEMLRNCQQFIGVHEVQRFVRWAERNIPELGKEIGKSLSLARLTEVVRRLAREGVSLRNARLLLEATLEWSPRERDPELVAEQVRLALRRQLCHEVARDGLIEVVMLSPELEDLLRGALRQTSQGSCLELEPDVERGILDGLAALAGSGGGRAALPVLLAAADIRRALRKLIEAEFFQVPVFAFAELSEHARVRAVGMLAL
ncbi:type III secretion system export apparatus subunit SctV [Oxalobacteraceae bacterium]|nr:type III secretion system export apparatus subunit SctV [Oxalobacteraceae bacterium]